MSEFTYACPVCHQHLKCTASQAGTVMKCPTCYQRIVAPQAPSRLDTGFILSGHRYVEKMTTLVPTTPVVNQPQAPEKSGMPIVIIITLLVLLVVFGSALLGYHLKSAAGKSAAGWQTSDIGNVGVAGSFQQAQGVFSISGSGDDIWNQADAFRYVFQPQNGDCTLTVRGVSLDNTHTWAKAALLIRESLNADAKFAMVFISPTSGIPFQQRNRTGGTAALVANNFTLKPPCWIRLIRLGDVFTAYTSPNGADWKKLGSTTINMEKTVYAGLAVCSHRAGILCAARFDNVALLAGQATKP